MKYIDAIRNVIINEMENNEKIIVMGQDVREWGGSSGLFKGLDKRFKCRVINTPISEAATVGIGIGAAMNGMRPIIEFTFFDFLLCAADPIINHAAKIKALSNGDFNVPLIIRGVLSSHRGYGATHSQNLEYIFMCPGLNVVYPSNPDDAAGLMRYALNQSDPVLFIEHKLLHNMEGEVTSELVPFGKAKIRQKGKNLGIITYGRLVPIVERIIKDMDVELLDLRSLNPLDKESIIAISRKAEKILIIEDGIGFVASKVAAIVHENSNAKVKILHAKEFPIPAAKNLENYVLLTDDKITEVITSFIK
ncbi:MAG: transketolase C-terminal domain-containing protein [Candidatus Micrarchaeia archaeon]